jgi:NAD(P)-dependent dehydrogenase (short-subunit alcohol dehydrogenase family)
MARRLEHRRGVAELDDLSEVHHGEARAHGADDFETALIKNTPSGRLGTPADIAPAALFLASPAADYVTGEVLAVNGGAFAGRMYLPLSTPKAR